MIRRRKLRRLAFSIWESEDNSMPKNQKLNLAIIGAGRMGARWARILSRMSGVRLAAIVDKNQSLAESVARECGGTCFRYGHMAD